MATGSPTIAKVSRPSGQTARGFGQETLTQQGKKGSVGRHSPNNGKKGSVGRHSPKWKSVSHQPLPQHRLFTAVLAFGTAIYRLTAEDS